MTKPGSAIGFFLWTDRCSLDDVRTWHGFLDTVVKDHRSDELLWMNTRTAPRISYCSFRLIIRDDLVNAATRFGLLDLEPVPAVQWFDWEWFPGSFEKRHLKALGIRHPEGDERFKRAMSISKSSRPPAHRYWWVDLKRQRGIHAEFDDWKSVALESMCVSGMLQMGNGFQVSERALAKYGAYSDSVCFLNAALTAMVQEWVPPELFVRAPLGPLGDDSINLPKRGD